LHILAPESVFYNKNYLADLSVLKAEKCIYLILLMVYNGNTECIIVCYYILKKQNNWRFFYEVVEKRH